MSETTRSTYFINAMKEGLHAAMTEELETLAQSDPHEFTPDQIWVLIRAIKVQGQILQLYLGEPVLDA